MSEYWKSTPKYWCKFCKIYVRDTTLERRQHEATGKHQGNIQRSLRELHKNQGKEDREKQRAKDEVARITGAVAGKPAPKAGLPQPVSVAKSKPHFTRPEASRATADDKRRQAEQLASMGVAVPDEFRKDMAVAGEWSVVSATPVYHRPALKDENSEGEGDGEGLSTAGTKRLRSDDQDEAEDMDRLTSRRKVWGTTLKSYPSGGGGQMDDLDSLLATTVKKQEPETNIKIEPDLPAEQVPLEEKVSEGNAKDITHAGSNDPVNGNATAAPEAEEPPVVFKKRKGKR